MIKLSIVTTTYNRIVKLEKNIERVKSQNFNSKEHIIVDNLSDDGTEDLVKIYQKSADYPVKYIREKDSGPYQGMNKGIRMAKGQWIHILNSDDYYYSNTILSQILKDNMDKFDILACGIMIKDKEKEKYWRPEYKKEIRHYNFPHPGIIIKKQFYTDNGCYNERFKIISDAIFIAGKIKKADYFVVDKPLVLMDSGGLSAKKSVRNLLETLLCINYYQNFPLSYKLGFSLQTLIPYFVRIWRKDPLKR